MTAMMPGETMTAAQYQGRQTEAQFQRTVVEAAEKLGWLTLHIPNAICNPSGIPDLFLWRDGEHLLIELKTRPGRIGREQRRWHVMLADAGFPVLVFYPDQWPDIERALAERGEP